MKLIAEFEDGKRVELKEVEGINSDSKILLMKLNSFVRLEDLHKMEDDLSNRIGVKVVLLHRLIDKVLSI